MSAPALFAAVPLLTGVVLGALAHVPTVGATVALFLAWILALVALARRWASIGIAASACGCLAAGAVIGARAAERAASPPLLAWFHRHAPETPVRLSGILRTDASPSPSGISLLLDVRDAGSGDGLVHARGGVRLSVSGALAAAAARDWTEGRRVTLVAALREPIDYRDPGVPGDRDRLARQEIALTGSVKSAALIAVDARGTWLQESAAALRAHVRNVTRRAVGRWSARAAGVVTAILIGDRSGLDADDERRLQEAGTYHVIAISGGNIALLTALLVLLGRWMGLAPRTTAAAAIVLLAFYGYAAGLAASVLRATLAGIIFLAARVLDQRGPALNTLAVVSAVAAVSAPLSLLDPGFVLSYAATLAIVVAAERFIPAPERAPSVPPWRRTLHVLLVAARALGVATLCAEIALAPIGARLFGRISLAGLVLNFAAIPLMSLIQIAGLAAVLCDVVSAGAASVCGWIAHHATRALVGSAGLVDIAPWLVLDVPPPSLGTIAAWYAGWVLVIGALTSGGRLRRRLVGAGAALIIVSALLLAVAPSAVQASRVAPPPPGWTRIVFLDVGQGDATIVMSPDRAPVSPLLVDAGGSAGGSFDVGRRVVVPALWALGVRRLGSVVLTHGDPDHIGGAPAVVRALHPGGIFEGVPVPHHQPLLRVRDVANAQGIEWRAVHAGETLASGPPAIRVLHPPAPDWERRKVRNDDSVVLDVRIGDVEIVLPGDIGRDVERAIAPHLGQAPIVIVKAPHHGSAGSSSPVFVDAAHPAAVIFSAGRRNPFGHPAPVVVARYRDAGARIFRTDEDGAIFVDTDGRQAVVWTWVRRLQAPITLPRRE